MLALFALLATAAVALLRDTGTYARRSATDQISGLIDQARNLAITSRCDVVLAFAEPGDLPEDDAVCRVGLFKIDDWPDDASLPVAATPVKRWVTLEKGVVLLDGSIGTTPNPLDEEEITISYRSSSVKAHALVFHPRGGLRHPVGSVPVVLRVAEGIYRDGEPVARRSSGGAGIPQDVIRIGRSLARPYRTE